MPWGLAGVPVHGDRAGLTRARLAGEPGPPRSSRPGPALGKIGAWLNPRYDDDTRVRFVASAEAMGYPAAWLGFGSAAIGDLSLAERALDATTTITVATAIVNMRTNKPDVVARACHRIAARHGESRSVTRADIGTRTVTLTDQAIARFPLT